MDVEIPILDQLWRNYMEVMCFNGHLKRSLSAVIFGLLGGEQTVEEKVKEKHANKRSECAIFIVRERNIYRG